MLYRVIHYISMVFNGLINSPSFVSIFQVLDMCTLGDAKDINSEIKFLPHSLQHIRIDCSDCMFDPFFHLCYITWQRGT